MRYFGPFAHAWAIRETLDLLLRVFPARTCSAGVFKRHSQIGRPCLLGYIDKCSAPCVGKVSADEHRDIVLDFCDFLAGKTDHMVRRLEREMSAAAEELEFERAARLRDDLGALRRAMEKQAVVLGDGTDADVMAFAQDELEVSVQVFHVRGGRVRGQRGWVLDKVEAVDDAALVDQFIMQFYGDNTENMPREVLVPVLPDDAAALEDLLSEQRGSRVALRVPQRGDKRALMETVARNASEAFAQHKLRRAGDLTARSAALQELQDALALDTAPLRIECIDISHVQGTDVVASLVVFEDGLARKSEYRRFAIREAATEGDVASIAEVVRRRFQAMLRETASGGPNPGIDPDTGKPRKFAYPPNLLVVDGAAPRPPPRRRPGRTGHHRRGHRRPRQAPGGGLGPRRARPGHPPRTSDALYLLQRVRDEAHRFAIAYHRQKRSKRMIASELDDVPGLGETRKAALLRHFGSVRKLRQATVDEISDVPGVGRRTAEAVVASLASSGGKS